MTPEQLAMVKYIRKTGLPILIIYDALKRTDWSLDKALRLLYKEECAKGHIRSGRHS